MCTETQQAHIQMGDKEQAVPKPDAWLLSEPISVAANPS